MDKKYAGIDISEWRGKENNEIIQRANRRLRKLNLDSDWLADDNGPLTLWNVDKDIALLGDILRYVHDLEQRCIRIEEEHEDYIKEYNELKTKYYTLRTQRRIDKVTQPWSYGIGGYVDTDMAYRTYLENKKDALERENEKLRNAIKTLVE